MPAPADDFQSTLDWTALYLVAHVAYDLIEAEWFVDLEFADIARKIQAAKGRWTSLDEDEIEMVELAQQAAVANVNALKIAEVHRRQHGRRVFHQRARRLTA